MVTLQAVTMDGIVVCKELLPRYKRAGRNYSHAWNEPLARIPCHNNHQHHRPLSVSYTRSRAKRKREVIADQRQCELVAHQWVIPTLHTGHSERRSD